MRLIVDRGRRGTEVVLADPEDFGSFVTELLGGGSSGRVTAAEIACVGALHPSGDVLVSPRRVRELAGERGHDQEWNRRFGEMIEWAASRGWIDEQGRIRAHVEVREQPDERVGKANPGQPSRRGGERSERR
ncbi:hypothetical protein [Nocardia sp. NPDC003963]